MTRTWRTRAAAVAVTAAAVAAVAGPGLATPASAGGMTYGQMYCDMEGVSSYPNPADLGHPHITCYLAIGGGEAPYTTYWAAYSDYGPFSFTYQDASAATLDCTKGSTVTVYADVYDGWGSHLSMSYTLDCTW